MSRATKPRLIDRRRAGFTLIELMVALGIFMVLGILSYRALSSIIESRDRVGVEQRRWQTVTRFMQRLELDLQQLPLGLPGALTYDPGARTLRLVRLISGPAGDEVRTIRYRWREGVVERDERKMRVAESVADGDQLVAPDVVLDSALEVEWRWSEAQPKSGAAMIWQTPPLTRGDLPPAAIQLRLKLTGVAGDLIRVVALR
jgi:general secretion pathway protein J